MKIGSSLALIGVGAILAFAVTATPSFFNLHTAGWVIMLIGVIGLLLPNRTVGWLGRRVLVRRSYPGRQAERVPVSYVTRDPGASTVQRGLPSRPTLLEQDDLVEDAEPGYDVVEETEVPGYHPPTGRPQAGATEVIEDLYEQP
jgi:hypothetical protein